MIISTPLVILGLPHRTESCEMSLDLQKDHLKRAEVNSSSPRCSRQGAQAARLRTHVQRCYAFLAYLRDFRTSSVTLGWCLASGTLEYLSHRALRMRFGFPGRSSIISGTLKRHQPYDVTGIRRPLAHLGLPPAFDCPCSGQVVKASTRSSSVFYNSLIS